jgi:hypothetical protein
VVVVVVSAAGILEGDTAARSAAAPEHGVLLALLAGVHPHAPHRRSFLALQERRLGRLVVIVVVEGAPDPSRRVAIAPISHHFRTARALLAINQFVWLTK